MTMPCTRCRDAGWYQLDLDVNHPDFGKLHRCECQQPADKAKKVQELRQTSGMGALSYQTFDTFNTTIPGILKRDDLRRGLREQLVHPKRSGPKPRIQISLFQNDGAGELEVEAIQKCPADVG